MLVDITPQMIVEKRDELENGKTILVKKQAPDTVNRYLAALSHVSTTGMDRIKGFLARLLKQLYVIY